MLTKEECINAKSDLQMANDYPNSKYNDSRVIDNAIRVFFRLIIEHFELVKKYDELYERHSKILDDVHDYRYETQSMKITTRNLCKHFGVKNEEGLKNIYLCKPYKFEDLHEGMWVWDDEERECRKILETYVTGEDNDVYVKGVRIVRHGLHEFSWKYSVFKEGRFFPVTKAMEYQKKMRGRKDSQK